MRFCFAMNLTIRCRGAHSRLQEQSCVILSSVFVLVLLSTSAYAQRGRGGAAPPSDGGPDGLGALHFRPTRPRRQSRRVDHRRAGRCDDRLHRRGRRRHLEDHRRRHQLARRSSTTRTSPRSARSPWRRPRTTWSGPAPGEPWLIRPYYTLGDGVYKSTDAGRTWQHMGLDATGHIARIVDRSARREHRLRLRDRPGVTPAARARRLPHDRRRRDVAAGPLRERRTPAARTSRWIRAIRRRCSPACGSSSIHRWDLHSGGPGSGVYVTHDGGATWTKIAGHGLPAADHALGKIAVAVAPSNPNRVYALVQDAPAPGLYRSNDRGATLAARQPIASAGRALAVLHAHGRVARR